MKCLILAGGFATRLWPLSEKRVKPLLHVKDRPLLSHLLGMFPNDVKIWVAVNRAYSAGIETWARNEGHGRVQVVIEESSNDAEKKGALGAVAAFVQSHGMEEDLMVVAGDNYFGFAMKDFLAAFQGKPLLAAHDVKEVSAARRFGVVQSQAGRMTGFEEKPEHPKSTLVSTGCYLFPQKNLGDIVVYAAKHKDNLGGIFEHFLTQGQPVDVFEFSEPWYDIGSFESYLAANLELLDGQAVLEEGV
ncbi:nucleotidyltransferase family protein, partial [Candidatus Parvarchaeota archaeon]|nr:nucleotidyltransferase family protein [Candidatus Parvarchaeota archaeon]